MTRKEQILNKAIDYSEIEENFLEYDDCGDVCDDKTFIEKAFIEGAMWADKNPYTQEEKAKTYDKVIKLEKNFSEFKENEDERIKIAILNHLKKMWGNSQDDVCGIHVEDAIDWIEKQGKQVLVNFDEAEKEKSEFVGDGFIECHADFLDFKEGNTYWLEYIGDDNYNVRSDNLLGKTYHITPGQLYTIFKKLTWIEKQCDKRLIEKATEWLKNTIDEDVLVKCGNVIKCIDANDFSEYFYKAMLEK